MRGSIVFIMCVFLIIAVESPVQGNKDRGPVPKTDILLARTDKQGNLEWSKQFSYGHETYCAGAIGTRNGGIALIACADSCVLEHRPGCWMIVMNEEGNLDWTRCYDMRLRRYDTALFMQMQDGRFIIVNNNWMSCLSERGEIIWYRKIDWNIKWFELKKAAPYGIDGFIFAGTGPRVPGKDPKGGWVIRTDFEGRQIWTQKFDIGYTSYVSDACVAADGRIIVVGVSYPDNQPNITGTDGWVVILDSLGNILQNRIYGRTVKIGFEDVHNAPDGGFLLLGTKSAKYSPWADEDGLGMRIDDNGDSLWSRRDGEGLENADSSLSQDPNKLPAGYLDRVIAINPPYHTGRLVTRKKLGGMFSQLRANGLTGRIQYGGAGIIPDSFYNPGGYFYAGSVVQPLSLDSTESSPRK